MKSEDDLDDFKRALRRFSAESKLCAAKAADIQLAFNKWGRMVTELHATTEQKSGQTAIQAGNTALDKQLADIENTFATERKKSTGEEVKQVKTALDKAESRLGESIAYHLIATTLHRGAVQSVLIEQIDRAMDNVPGPWATVIQSAVTSFVGHAS